MKSSIRNTIYRSEIGYILISERSETIINIVVNEKLSSFDNIVESETLIFDDLTDRKGVRDEKEDRFLENISGSATSLVVSQIKEYLNGERYSFDLPLHVDGTLFQHKVWSALERVGYGEVISYKDLSIMITGDAKSSRAVGGALNKNPFHIVVPCHRIVGVSGKLTGYKSGLSIKEKLLNLEKISSGKIIL